MNQESIKALVQEMVKESGPMTEVQARAAAVDIVNKAQSDAAILNRIKSRNEAAKEWVLPDIAAVDPGQVSADRDQAFANVKAGLAKDTAKNRETIDSIITAVSAVGMAVVAGNPAPAIVAAIPTITQALMALSGGAEQ